MTCLLGNNRTALLLVLPNLSQPVSIIITSLSSPYIALIV